MTVADEQPPGMDHVPRQVDIDGGPGARGQNAEDDSGFDIGVGSPAYDGTAPDDDNPGRRRRLPAWAFAALALLIGWLLGSLLGSPNPVTAAAGEATGAAAPTDLATPALDSAQLAAPALDSAAPATPGLAIPNARLVLARQSDVGPSAAAITVVDSQGAITIVLADGLADSPPGGRIGRPVVTSGTHIYSLVGRQVSVVDVATGDPPLILTEADLLLAGTGSGNLWAALSTTRTVRFIDADSRSVRATYDLSGIGVPLGSYDGGLIVAPDIDEFGPFALWSPARGIERIWSLDEQTTFIDSAGSTIVVHNTRGLASYNTVTGSSTQLSHTLSDDSQAASTVSPSGTRLAIIDRPVAAGPTVVAVVDLSSGETIDQFETTDVETLRWVTNDALLHMAASNQRQVQLRDVDLGFDTSLIEVDPTMSWMVLTD